MTPRSKVFCDYLTITTPKEDYEGVMDRLTPYLDDMGCAYDDKSGGYRPPTGGLFVAHRERYGISIFTASGGFMQALRDTGNISAFISEFSSCPHNVSSLDLTIDEYIPAPERLHDIYQLAASGLISFTRKALKPSGIRRLMRPALYGSSLFETGTLYLGKRGKHEVHAKVYDKRNESLDRTGKDIPDALRHELTVSGKMGVTLRDIVEPEACFYHFYPAEILPRDAKTEWRGGGEGFEVNRPESKLPAQKLAYRVETSTDLQNLMTLAAGLGESGLQYLLTTMARRYAQVTGTKPLKVQLVAL